MRRGCAALLTLAALGLGLLLAGGALADSTEPHDPILLDGDDDAHADACDCITDPSAAGTEGDPYIIEGWRIQGDADVGIEIRNMDEAHILVQNNSVETHNGIHLVDTGTRVDLEHNEIDYDGMYGIKLQDASPEATSNVIRGWTGWCGCPSGTGIRADGSAPTLDGNTISQARYGIRASAATPTIQANELYENKNGIVLEASADATIEDNLIRLSVEWAIKIQESSQAHVEDNDLRQGKGGVFADSAHKLTLVSNTMTNMDEDAVRFSDTDVDMTDNHVSDNWRGAVGSHASDLLIEANTFTNNGDDAITLTETSGDVRSNLLEKNEGTAIALESSIVNITDNQLADNTFGLSIPYESRQAIEKMSGNIVNGKNIDGTLTPSEQRLFYKETAVAITSEVIDSGHSDGYYGVHTRQGALVLYDVTGATIQANTFQDQAPPDPSPENGRALHLHGTTNADVQGNLFHNNDEGLVATDSRTFVKDNECRIDVDPPETVCFEARGGHMDVEDNSVENIDVGIHLTTHAGTATTGTVLNNDVHGTTSAGIMLEGDYSSAPIHVDARNNDVQDNHVGFHLTYMKGTLEANHITGNDAGIHVTDRSAFTLQDNDILDNGHGLLDIGPTCPPPETQKCSSATLTSNQIIGNDGIGIRLMDGATLDGDTIQDNQVGLDVHGTTTLTNVLVEANELGLRSKGTLTLEATTVQSNEKGITAQGSLTLLDTDVTSNAGLGIEASGEATIDASAITANEDTGVLVDGTVHATDSTFSQNEGTGLDVDGSAGLEDMDAIANAGHGVSITGHGSLAEVTMTGNEDAGLRLSGSAFEVQACQLGQNGHGILVEEGVVEVGQDFLDVAVDLTRADTDATEVRVSECDIVDNEGFALWTHEDAFVEAQLNHWGEDGPVYNTPLERSPNTVSNHAIVTPYWQDKAHTQTGFVPSFEAAPGLSPLS